MASDFLWWAWVAFIMATLLPSQGDGRRFIRVMRRIRVGVVLSALALIVAVVLVGVTLCAAVPVLNWSWLSLVGTTSSNVNFAPMEVSWLAPIFLLLFMAKIPVIAEQEERWFRKGTTTWWQACWRSLAFGFVHCAVGVPLGFGAALSVLGFGLTLAYWRGGLMAATTLHATYNWIAVGLITLLFVA